MKVLFSTLFALFISANAAFAGSPDDHAWQVRSKQCGALAIPVAGDESYQFKSGFLGRTYVSSESETRRCKSVLGYSRTTQSIEVGDNYSETSILSTRALRTACRDKASNTLISDETKPLPEKTMTLSLKSRSNTLSASLTGTDECPDSVLQLEMTLK